MEKRYMKEFRDRMKNHEPETNNKLFDLAMGLPKDAVVIDCGAHVGDTGIKLAKRLRDEGRQDIKIVEIEPAEDKIKFIKKQAKLAGVEKQLVFHNAGLWDKSTGGRIIRTNKNTGAWKVEECSEKTSEFKLRRLDDLVDRIDLVHLDVEGSEPKALMGMKKLIDKHHPPLIVEVIHSNDDTLPILDKMGYKQSGGQMLYDRLYLYDAGTKAEKMKAERMAAKDDKPSPYIPLIVLGSVLICGAVLLWIDKRRRNREKIGVVAVLE